MQAKNKVELGPELWTDIVIIRVMLQVWLKAKTKLWSY